MFVPKQLARELGTLAGRGATPIRASLQPYLCKIARAGDVKNPWQQGEIVIDFLKFEIGHAEGRILICKKYLTPDVYGPAYLMNLGLDNPHVRAEERRILTVKLLGLSYPPSTWRREAYEGRFLEQLAWRIVQNL
jgi:hypothetical protein